MKRSSSTPPSSRQSTLYCAPPIGSRETSLESSRCSSSSLRARGLDLAHVRDVEDAQRCAPPCAPGARPRTARASPSRRTRRSWPRRDVAVVQGGAAQGRGHGPQAIDERGIRSVDPTPSSRPHAPRSYAVGHMSAAMVRPAAGAAPPGTQMHLSRACVHVLTHARPGTPRPRTAAFKSTAQDYINAKTEAGRRCRRRRSPARSADDRRCGDRDPGASGPPRVRRVRDGGRSRCRSR